jgi:hypothetical protein
MSGVHSKRILSTTFTVVLSDKEMSMSKTISTSFVWTKEQVAALEWNGRYGGLRWKSYRNSVGARLAPIIRGLFHNQPRFDGLAMETISLTLRTKRLPSHWGWVLAIEYRFAGQRGHRRCVAHFMPKAPGAMDGQLFFTPPKFYAK